MISNFISSELALSSGAYMASAVAGRASTDEKADFLIVDFHVDAHPGNKQKTAETREFRKLCEELAEKLEIRLPIVVNILPTIKTRQSHIISHNLTYH